MTYLPLANITINWRCVEIAILCQFLNPGIRDWCGWDPGAHYTYRDSNPGPTFSILGFRIEILPMPGSRQDYVMIQTQDNITQPHANHTVHNSHKDGCRTFMVGWYCSILDAKEARKKLNNIRKKCNGTLLSPDCTAYDCSSKI
jgi:hypothetical protein